MNKISVFSELDVFFFDKVKYVDEKKANNSSLICIVKKKKI